MASKIEQQVMASVGIIYGVKALISATALKLYALVAAVYALGVLVWVARVEQNFTTALRGGLPKVLSYSEVAVAHTTIYVQLTLLVIALAGISLVFDLMRSVSHRQSAFA